MQTIENNIQLKIFDLLLQPFCLVDLFLGHPLNYTLTITAINTGLGRQLPGKDCFNPFSNTIITPYITIEKALFLHLVEGRKKIGCLG